mmetsp:Transcript_46478/g.91465  ORF Transcript_46478/g.91465 Transcript_46478/m.91465 type:complete len:200 (-) Transcript_46478:591-1190(-)
MGGIKLTAAKSPKVCRIVSTEHAPSEKRAPAAMKAELLLSVGSKGAAGAPPAKSELANMRNGSGAAEEEEEGSKDERESCSLGRFLWRLMSALCSTEPLEATATLRCLSEGGVVLGASRGEHEAMVTREERGELSTALLWLGGGVGGADTTAATAAAAACGGVIGWLFGYGADKLGLPVVLSVTGWLLVCISMVWMVVL